MKPRRLSTPIIVPDGRLRAKLYPVSKWARNIHRIIRRMRYYGGGMAPLVGDVFHKRRHPGTWVGVVNMVLQRRAKARKVRR